MMKSIIVTEKRIEWVSEPLIPITAALYNPAGPRVSHDRSTEAEPKGRLTVTFAEVDVAVMNMHEIAFDEDVAVRLTLPKNPLTPLTVMIVSATPPRGAVWDANSELATMRVTVAQCVTDPLVPVTLTVYLPNGVALVVATNSSDSHPQVGDPLTNSIVEGNSENERPTWFVVARVTIPEKPLTVLTSTAESNPEKPG